MNEVAKRNDVGEIVVSDPFSPETYHSASNVSGLIRSANNHLVYRRGQFDGLGPIDEAPLAAVTTLRRALVDDDDSLKDFEKNLKDALLELSGFKSYVVQTKGAGARIDPLSVRGKIAEMVKQLKAREDAEKPKEPTHTYFYAVTCTDAEHVAIQKAIKKVDGGFGVVVPQNDDEWIVADELFKGNGGNLVRCRFALKNLLKCIEWLEVSEEEDFKEMLIGCNSFVEAMKAIENKEAK